MNFTLVASKSAGNLITFRNKDIKVQDLSEYDFAKAKITFFAAGSKLAEKLVEEAQKKTIVIDNSSYFRLKKDVPLVVAEVNPESLKTTRILFQIQIVQLCKWF